MVIGKSKEPRCFKGYLKASLPVIYYANRIAWVTSEIFRNWLQLINNQIMCKNRKIILFIDNCGAHPDVQLNNVAVEFLPPNTTSRLQPLDAGIIKTVKSIYRKHLLRHVLFRMDEVTTASQLAKCVNVLDAITWLVALNLPFIAQSGC